MNKNRAAGSRLQILTGPQEESHQLDLLSFVSDYALADLSPEEKQGRTSIVKKNIAKTPAYHFQGNVDKSKTFSNFCLGNSNQFAVEAIKRFIFNDKSDFNMMYLKASSGLGKSHILHAVANEMFLRKKTFTLSSPFMMSLLIDNFNALKFYEFILIDDIEEIEGNSEMLKLFCQLIDYAQSGRMKLIITGSKLPKELNDCDDRFKGKLSAALIHNVFEMNNVLAYEIVNSKCEGLNLILPESVKELVSNQLDFNVYGLESLLHKFKNTSDIKSREITFKMALKEIKDKNIFYSQDDFTGFLKIVANSFSVSFEGLISTDRRKEFALARHVAMYVLKEKAGLSLTRISKLFNKDHSSVIYAVTRIKKQLENDLKMRDKVLKLLSDNSFLL
ncbi:MAG: hypothetical protein H7281_12080 [Bacteriovorax sp.]|nr:hypothetical protein [Bacteriovorax sp.]